MAGSENKFVLYIYLCTAPSEDHANVSRLIGAAHAAIKEDDAKKQIEEAAKLQTEEDKRRKVCGSNRMWVEPRSCHQPVQLSTQMLRTCRQVNLDATLLPFSTNTVKFSGALPDILRHAFVQKFSLKQRRAIQTAIVNTVSAKCVQRIPDVLPGLKHLWLKSLGRLLNWDDEAAFTCLKLQNLVGVAVQMGKRLWESNPPFLDRECEDMEWALLNKEDRKDLERIIAALTPKWDSDEETTYYFWQVRFGVCS